MLERAAAELEQLGAIRHRDAAERDLRRIRHRTHPRIADELFLSTKTVETHIRNIFGTRGADSRIEVARMAEQADGVTRRRTGSAHPRQLPESIDSSGRRPQRPGGHNAHAALTPTRVKTIP